MDSLDQSSHLPQSDHRDEWKVEHSLARQIEEDFTLAFAVLGSSEQAWEVVDETNHSFDTERTKVWYNRRDRLRRSADTPKMACRPFMLDCQIRRKQLLSHIRKVQIKAELQRRKPPHEHYNLLCLLQELAAISLNRDVFCAAVAVTQVIGYYSSNQTLGVYEHVMGGDGTSKLQSSVSRKKDELAVALNARFLARIQHTDSTRNRFVRVSPTEQQNALIRKWLPRFLPSREQVAAELQAGHFSDPTQRKECMALSTFFNVDRFNTAASQTRLKLDRSGKAEPPLMPLDKKLMLPVINEVDFDGHFPDRGPNSAFFAGKVDELMQSVAKARHKRQHVHPRAIHLFVDGEEHTALELFGRRLRFRLPQSSSNISLVATDADGERVTLATSVLAHDAMNPDLWKVAVPHLGTVHCGLSYSVDGRVTVELLTDSKPTPMRLAARLDVVGKSGRQGRALITRNPGSGLLSHREPHSQPFPSPTSVQFWSNDQVDRLFGAEVSCIICLNTTGAVRMYSRSAVVRIDMNGKQGVICTDRPSQSGQSLFQFAFFECLDRIRRGFAVLLMLDEPGKPLSRNIFYSAGPADLDAICIAYEFFETLSLIFWNHMKGKTFTISRHPFSENYPLLDNGNDCLSIDGQIIDFCA